jgi:ATP-dependent exoDNAse (exonuclease V) beta subunit
MPLQHRQANGTIVRGTCDLALETESGWIIIDHKTFPGTQQEAQTKAQQFIPQLTAYAAAVQRATGAPVLGTYLHLPLRGEIIVLKIMGNG